MLCAKAGLYCGVFDSNILRGAQSKSPDRKVMSFEIELFHCAGGTSHVDTQKYPTGRGMLLCAKPGQIRHSDFPVRCSFIRIPPGVDEEIEKLLCLLPDCTYLSNEDEIDTLMALFSRLGACFVGAAEGLINDVRSNFLLMEILYRISRLCLGTSEEIGVASVSRITREAYEFINENYRSDCSLKAIAAAVQISPNHLHAVFSRETGLTPYEYALKLRIARAQRLIMAGDMSMLEIALETGFCSQSHFNKVFREKTGTTPVQYRKTLQQQGVDRYEDIDPVRGK